jgi:hypothetical protein
MPGPPGACHDVILPGDGVNLNGCSALIRHSIGMAAELDVALAERQLLARGDAQLGLDDVDAGDHLGDRVFHLHARVHLDEEELALLVQELEGAGAAVADLAAGLCAAIADPGHLARRQPGRRGLFDDLLVAALHRAVAGPEGDRVAVLVRENLHLDVARVLEVLLHVDRRVAERRAGFATRRADGVEQRGLGVDDAHAAPATAAGRLDDHRVADAAGDPDDLLRVVGQRTLDARHDRHARLLHRDLGADLVAHHPDGVGPRTDEHEAALLDALGEIGVLGQEAVAGVDRLGVGDLGRADDRGHVQVAVGGRRRPDADGLVGEAHVLGVGVGLGMHGDGLHTQLATGAEDAQGDLAPVGDQDLVEHDQPITNIGCPYSTAWPFSTWMALTTPDTSASISFISFIASMMHSVSPALTVLPTSTKGAASGPLDR